MKTRTFTGRATINVHHGDCMDGLEEAREKQWDLAICDPPYNLQRFRNGIGKGDRHTVKTHGTEWNNNVPTLQYWACLFSVARNSIIWGANNFELPPSEYFCIWDKQQTVENFASAEYARVSMGLKSPAKVFRYSIHKHNQSDKIHPTQKPVALYKWLLQNYAKEGDTILDTHGGSMSIAIACWDMGFDLDIWELDEDYFKAGCERIEKHTKQLQFDF